jgi:transcriptional regulator with XRE-family HTH domain
MKRSDYFAERITHFLKGYRKKNNLTQSQLAVKLGTTKSTVSRIENDQDKQVTLVIGILENLGKLENMDLGVFLAYLDGKNVGGQTDDALFPWQRAAISALEGIKQSVRLELVADVFSQKTERREQLFTLLVKLSQLPEASQELITRLVDEMQRKA